MEKRPKVGEILVEAGVIDELQLRAALGDQANWGARLGLTLVKMGLIEESDLVWALAQQLKLPVVKLEGKRIRREILDLVPVELAEKHMCVPLFVKRHEGVDTLFIGMDDPGNLDALDDLGFRTGLRVRPALVAASELCEAIDRFYHRPASGSTASEGSGDAHGLEEGAGERGGAAIEAGISSMPEISESLFPELAESDEAAAGAARRLSDEADPGSRDPQPPAPTRDPAPAASTDQGNRTVLHALCRLLVEKGVIGPEELGAVVRELKGR
jgi:type IV pilus assembly protein PilB